MKQLILGGARSGKSSEAESRAIVLSHKHTLNCIYIATAQAFDNEMQSRIHQHKQDRNNAATQPFSTWKTVEEPIELATTLNNICKENTCVLVDCLTLWLSNCLHHDVWQAQKDMLFNTLPTLPGHIIFVSNEVGNGIVPIGELNRLFVDEAGRLHQQLAQTCEHVSLVVAGIAMPLK